MRKCRCINDWNLGVIYLYEVDVDSSPSYPYHIYTLDNRLIATFSYGYFDVMFIDIQDDRLKKLKKISNECESR